jgi:hypothetical protein
MRFVWPLITGLVVGVVSAALPWAVYIVLERVVGCAFRGELGCYALLAFTTHFAALPTFLGGAVFGGLCAWWMSKKGATRTKTWVLSLAVGLIVMLLAQIGFGAWILLG